MGSRNLRWSRHIPLFAAVGIWLLAGCGGGDVVMGDRIEVPTSPYVSLPAESQTQVADSLRIIESKSATSVEKAQAYLYVADVNLFLWDELQRQADALDESEGKTFRKMTESGRTYFLQAHRARAKAWAQRAASKPEFVESGGFEKRFAEVWQHHAKPAKAYEGLAALYGDVISAKEEEYVDVDFLSDLRYSTAIFYTIENKPAGDMEAVLAICKENEAEAVRLAGDVAYLYDRLSLRPQMAADTYRAIATTKPTTREGYEAQVQVLKALQKTQRVAAMDVGSADEFDTSEEGIELFRAVNRDLDLLAEMAAYKRAWKDTSDDVGNMDAQAEELVRTFTVRMHGLAQQQDNSTFFELAANAYERYHTIFPRSGHAYQMLYFHAEALYRLGDFDSAYQRYKEALGRAPHGKYREDIIRNLVLSAHKRCEAEPLPTAVSETRIEMPAAHRDFIGSGEQFISVLGEADPAFGGYVRYEITLRHYVYGEMPVAETILDEFVRNHSSHPQAPKAAVLWLDILARDVVGGGDREKRSLEGAIERIRATKALMGDEQVRRKLEEVSAKPPVIGGWLP